MLQIGSISIYLDKTTPRGGSASHIDVLTRNIHT